MEMTTVKTFAVFAVIFGCFAVLYPKIFHPIVLNIFGLSPPPRNPHDDIMHNLPPHLRKPNMGKPINVDSSGGGGRMADDMARHMRAGAHPGMRAAADMQKQTHQGGGGKGMMTIVLPMYAVGIVLYLIYTLSKVFGGKKKGQVQDERTMRQMQRQGISEVRYDSDKKKFMYGEEESDHEEEDVVQNFKQSRRQQRDLERLLFKADKEQISDLEMRELKRRLLETESQMSRILNAMESVTEKVSQQTGRRLNTYSQENFQRYPEDGEFMPPRKTNVRMRNKQRTANMSNQAGKVHSDTFLPSKAELGRQRNTNVDYNIIEKKKMPRKKLDKLNNSNVRKNKANKDLEYDGTNDYSNDVPDKFIENSDDLENAIRKQKPKVENLGEDRKENFEDEEEEFEVEQGGNISTFADGGQQEGDVYDDDEQEDEYNDEDDDSCTTDYSDENNYNQDDIQQESQFQQLKQAFSNSNENQYGYSDDEDAYDNEDDNFEDSESAEDYDDDNPRKDYANDNLYEEEEDYRDEEADDEKVSNTDQTEKDDEKVRKRVVKRNGDE